MIRAWIGRRRATRAARLAQIHAATDLLLRRVSDDLDCAFWRAHERAVDQTTPGSERRTWRAVMDEIDRRRPVSRRRADTATRMLFRHRAL